MYRALLALGDYKSAANILNNIPRDDFHVCNVVKACQTAYGTSASAKGKKKENKTGKIVTYKMWKVEFVGDLENSSVCVSSEHAGLCSCYVFFSPSSLCSLFFIPFLLGAAVVWDQHFAVHVDVQLLVLRTRSCFKVALRLTASWKLIKRRHFFRLLVSCLKKGWCSFWSWKRNIYSVWHRKWRTAA